MRLVLGLVILSGCDVIFVLEDPTVGDDVAVPCDRGTPFGPGTEVPIDGIHSVEGARFDPTQSVAYLSLCPTDRGNKPECELYQAPFVVTTGKFGNLALLGGINDPGEYDAYPTITPDSKFILFGSSRDNGPHVYIAASNNGGFEGVMPMQVDVGLQYSNEPYIVGDGTTLYLSAATGALEWNLYRATGTPPNYGQFQKLDVVNSSSIEFCPVVSDDELEIFFASNRTDPSREENGLDIYTATRSSTGSPFSAPQPVTSLSTDGPDFPLWLSPDGCDLYYINKVITTTTEIGTLYVSSRRP